MHAINSVGNVETLYANDMVTRSGHNIAISNVTMNRTIIGLGNIEGIYVEVVNTGSFPQTFSVTVYANTTQIQTQMVTLEAGNSTILSFYWNTTGISYGNYTMSAVADTVPGETDTADNTYINGDVLVTIPGDIDGDGDVDPFDYTDFRVAFGSKCGQPNYNPWCDFDLDCDVDPFDFNTFRLNYGAHIPPPP